MNYTYITFPRGFLIGESENSLVLKIGKDLEIWVAKKLIKVSEYTLFATLSVGSDFEFGYVGAEEDDDSIGLTELIEVMSSLSGVTIKSPKKEVSKKTIKSKK